jgi:hypothetical protein
MTANPIAYPTKDANRLHCITDKSRSRYKLRIEDMSGKPLTEFLEMSRADAAWSVQLSTFAGRAIKEDHRISQDGQEDYRLAILNEYVIRAKLQRQD